MIKHLAADNNADEPELISREFSIGGGAYWAGQAVARPLFWVM